MTHSVIIRPEAEADLTEAIVWYEGRQAGLGIEFLAEVKATLERIAENPDLHRIVHNGVRRFLTYRFPYKVFYFTETDNVIILGVVHSKRYPRIWRGRV